CQFSEERKETARWPVRCDPPTRLEARADGFPGKVAKAELQRCLLVVANPDPLRGCPGGEWGGPLEPDGGPVLLGVLVPSLPVLRAHLGAELSADPRHPRCRGLRGHPCPFGCGRDPVADADGQDALALSSVEEPGGHRKALHQVLHHRGTSAHRLGFRRHGYFGECARGRRRLRLRLRRLARLRQAAAGPGAAPEGGGGDHRGGGGGGGLRRGGLVTGTCLRHGPEASESAPPLLL
ncbi:unnamed protein product, partial [Effrenium voratum]